MALALSPIPPTSRPQSHQAQAAAEAPRWVSLADAARITDHDSATVKTWIAASQSWAPPQVDGRTLSEAQVAQVRPAQLFAPAEVGRDGAGGYRIWVAALARVQQARGYYAWHPTHALEPRRMGPLAAEQMADLQDQVAALEAERAAMAAQLDALRRGRNVATATRVAAEDEAARGPLPPLPPDGLSVLALAGAHGFTPATSSTWRRHARFMEHVRTYGGPYLGASGHAIHNAVGPEGQRAFGRYFSASRHWQPCEAEGCLACLASADPSRAPGE